MTILAFMKTTLRFFYRLTVGLTVLLLQAGLLYLSCLLTLLAWFVLIGMVTWKTYNYTDHHLGWTVVACVVTALLSGGLIVGMHRVAKDVLGLTTMSLSEIISLLLMRRRAGPSQAERPTRDAGTHGATEGGGGEGLEVKVRRKVIPGGSSSVEARTTNIRQTTIHHQRR